MKTYHKNPRQITEKQFKDLEKWLEELGDLGGIVHDLNSDEVIGGNQRARVFDILRQENAPVVLTDEFDPIQWRGERYGYRQVRWTARQCEQANVVANRAGGAWDWDVLANEFEMGDLLEWGFTEFDFQMAGLALPEDEPPEDPGPQIDKAAELQEKWGTALGQVWELGEHRLVCGDCTDEAVVEAVMRGERARYGFNDPPYGIDVDTGWLSALNVKRGKPPNVSDDRLQGDDGTFDASICFGFDKWLTWGFPYVGSAEASGWLVWDKWPGVDGGGMGNPVEMASTNLWTGFRLVRVMWGGYYKASGESREPHPTQKPIGVIEPYIAQYTAPKVLIADFVLGSGTTLIACERLGRKCRGIEIEPKYIAVTLERWHQMTGVEPVLVSG
jgi:DNA modification methylase